MKYYLIGNEKDYACLKISNNWPLKEVFLTQKGWAHTSDKRNRIVKVEERRGLFKCTRYKMHMKTSQRAIKHKNRAHTTKTTDR